MDTSVVVNQVLMLFLPIVVGYAIIKLKVVDDSFKRNISAFLFNVTLPCSIISAMQFDFEPGMLVKSGLLIIVSLIIMIALWLICAKRTSVTVYCVALQGFTED